MLEKDFRDFLEELGARIRRMRQGLDHTIEAASERVEMHPVERSVKMPFKFSAAPGTTVSDSLDLESTLRPDATARELGETLRDAAPKHARTLLETAGQG